MGQGKRQVCASSQDDATGFSVSSNQLGLPQFAGNPFWMVLKGNQEETQPPRGAPSFEKLPIVAETSLSVVCLAIFLSRPLGDGHPTARQAVFHSNGVSC